MTKFRSKKSSIIAAIAVSGAFLFANTPTTVHADATNTTSDQQTTQKVTSPSTNKENNTTPQTPKSDVPTNTESSLNSLEQAAPVVLTNPNIKGQAEMETNGVKYSTSVSATDKFTGEKVTINGSNGGQYSGNRPEINGLIEYNKAKDVTEHIEFSNTTDKDKSLSVDFSGFVGSNPGVQVDTDNIDLNDGFVLTGDKGDTIHSTISLNSDALKTSADNGYHTMQYYIDHGYTTSEVANNASYIWFNNEAIKANETYTLDIPIKIEVTQEELKKANQLTIKVDPLFTYIDGQLSTNNSVITQASKPVTNFDQNENKKFLPVFRPNPKIENYHITAEDLAELTEAMPTLKDLVKVNNFAHNETNAQMYSKSQDMGTLWMGGHYFFDLDTVQQAIQKLGYSVNVASNNQGIYNYYSYQTTGDHANLNVGSNNITIGSGNFAGYLGHIEIHQVLNTQNLTYEVNSQDAKGWSDNITRSLAALPDGNLVNNINGKTDLDIKGDPAQVFLVDNGGYDPSKPGTYTITLGYKLQDSNNKTMLITKKATITITPKVIQPVTPPTSEPTPEPAPQPQPQPTPDEPSDQEPDTVKPQPEPAPDVDQNTPSEDDTIKPKAIIVSPTTNTTAPKATVNPIKELAETNIPKPKSQQITHVETDKKAQLPQTGEKDNSKGLIGLILTGLGIFGLFAGQRRKENN